MTATLAFLLASLLSAAPPAADPAGLWQAGTGEVFDLRREGADCWAFGRGPSRRVFHGSLQGNLLRGSWSEAAAAPGWAAGALSLRLESADRMVVTDATGAFGREAWTRLKVPAGAIALEWSTTAATAEDGDCFAAWCPPGGAIRAVWGSEVYTADSSVCSAAVHAGLASVEKGGTFTVRALPGQAGYQPSASNGVTSLAWGQYGASFTFARQCDPDRPRPGGSAASPIQASATTTAGRLKGKTAYFSCPPEVGQASVWGTDVYTDDSSVCSAAVHAGALKAAKGGVVAVEPLEGRRSYAGSARNGVTSAGWGTWARSFKVTPAALPAEKP